MGFYGKITNVSKNQFTFDKIYPTREAMDKHDETDGVHVGRFVLVDYNTEADVSEYYQTAYYAAKPVVNKYGEDSYCYILTRMAPTGDSPELLIGNTPQEEGKTPTYELCNEAIFDATKEYFLQEESGAYIRAQVDANNYEAGKYYIKKLCEYFYIPKGNNLAAIKVAEIVCNNAQKQITILTNEIKKNTTYLEGLRKEIMTTSNVIKQLEKEYDDAKSPEEKAEIQAKIDAKKIELSDLNKEVTKTQANLEKDKATLKVKEEELIQAEKEKDKVTNLSKNKTGMCYPVAYFNMEQVPQGTPYNKDAQYYVFDTIAQEFIKVELTSLEYDAKINPKDICNKCYHKGDIEGECPVCGSKDITRGAGYVGMYYTATASIPTYMNVGVTSDINTTNSQYVDYFNTDKHYCESELGIDFNRGYDSTVWQKVIVQEKHKLDNGEYQTQGVEKYVSIADLNSVVPTLDLAVDAPTPNPQAPYFDKNSNDFYYKIHEQPSWGFRIKPKDTLREFNWNAQGEFDSNDICQHYHENPSGLSDEYVVYSRVEHNPHGKSYTLCEEASFDPNKEYYKKVDGEFILDKTVDNNSYKPKVYYILSNSVKYYYKPSQGDRGTWVTSYDNEEDVKTPASIYYNLGGFDSHTKCYDVIDSNHITVGGTGVSGRNYNGKAAPDMQELSIHLPALGNAVSKMWDVVYGDPNLLESSETYAVKYPVGDAINNLLVEWDSSRGNILVPKGKTSSNVEPLPFYLYNELYQVYEFRPDIYNKSTYELALVVDGPLIKGHQYRTKDIPVYPLTYILDTSAVYDVEKVYYNYVDGRYVVANVSFDTYKPNKFYIIKSEKQYVVYTDIAQSKPADLSYNIYNVKKEAEKTGKVNKVSIQEVMDNYQPIIDPTGHSIHPNDLKQQSRNTDINWGSYEGVRLITNTPGYISKQDFNNRLNCLAGTINTGHDIIGQNIIHVDEEYWFVEDVNTSKDVFTQRAVDKKWEYHYDKSVEQYAEVHANPNDIYYMCLNVKDIVGKFLESINAYPDKYEYRDVISGWNSYKTVNGNYGFAYLTEDYIFKMIDEKDSQAYIFESAPEVNQKNYTKDTYYIKKGSDYELATNAYAEQPYFKRKLKNTYYSEECYTYILARDLRPVEERPLDTNYYIKDELGEYKYVGNGPASAQYSEVYINPLINYQQNKGIKKYFYEKSANTYEEVRAKDIRELNTKQSYVQFKIAPKSVSAQFKAADWELRPEFRPKTDASLVLFEPEGEVTPGFYSPEEMSDVHNIRFVEDAFREHSYNVYKLNLIQDGFCSLLNYHDGFIYAERFKDSDGSDKYHYETIDNERAKEIFAEAQRHAEQEVAGDPTIPTDQIPVAVLEAKHKYLNKHLSIVHTEYSHIPAVPHQTQQRRYDDIKNHKYDDNDGKITNITNENLFKDLFIFQDYGKIDGPAKDNTTIEKVFQNYVDKTKKKYLWKKGYYFVQAKYEDQVYYKLSADELPKVGTTYYWIADTIQNDPRYSHVDIEGDISVYIEDFEAIDNALKAVLDFTDFVLPEDAYKEGWMILVEDAITPYKYEDSENPLDGPKPGQENTSMFSHALAPAFTRIIYDDSAKRFCYVRPSNFGESLDINGNNLDMHSGLHYVNFLPDTIYRYEICQDVAYKEDKAYYIYDNKLDRYKRIAIGQNDYEPGKFYEKLDIDSVPPSNVLLDNVYKFRKVNDDIANRDKVEFDATGKFYYAPQSNKPTNLYFPGVFYLANLVDKNSVPTPENINDEALTNLDINSILLATNSLAAMPKEYYFAKLDENIKYYNIGLSYVVERYGIDNHYSCGEFYIPGYYARNYGRENGNTDDYRLDKSETVTNGLVGASEDVKNVFYFNPSPLYVWTDSKDIFEGVSIINNNKSQKASGAIWNHNASYVPGSIQLARRQTINHLIPIEEYGRSTGTLNGALLTILNKLSVYNDPCEPARNNINLTRNSDTVQGAINKLSDIIARFPAPKPGNIMMIDDYGRYHDTPYTTEQELYTINLGNNPHKISSIKKEEDQWIRFDFNANPSQTNIILEHKTLDDRAKALNLSGIKSAEDYIETNSTNTTSNLNKDAVDNGTGHNKDNVNEIQIDTPVIDNAGHVIGKNRETITLPYGFKSVQAENQNSVSRSFIGAGTGFKAEETQDGFKVKGGNKWLEVNAQNKVVTIDHTLLPKETLDNINSTTNKNEVDLNTVQSLNFDTLIFDEAGHVKTRNNRAITLPSTYSYISTNGDTKANTITTGSVVNTTIAANKSKDKFAVSPGNKWLNVVLGEPAGAADEIKIFHNAAGASVKFTGDASAQTPDYGTSFLVPYIGIDETGHVSTLNSHNVTLPQVSIVDEGTVIANASHANNTLTLTKQDLMDAKLSVKSTTVIAEIDQKLGDPNTAYPHITIKANDTLQTAISKVPDMVEEGIGRIIGASAPETLDTLKEVADWISKGSNAYDVNNYVSLVQVEKDFYGLDSTGKVKPYNNATSVQDRLTANEVNLEGIHNLIGADDGKGNIFDRLAQAEHTLDTYVTTDLIDRINAAEETLKKVQQDTGNMTDSVDGYMKYHVGTKAPTETNAMWIDTSDPNNILIKFPNPDAVNPDGTAHVSPNGWIAINTWQ